jgi:hypothetical protein
MSVSKTKSFVKEVVAILTGDNAEATAQKILRQADSAFKTQIASLTGDTIVFEDKLEDAKEALRLARLNYGKTISDRNNYIYNLIDAKNRVVDAEEDLDPEIYFKASWKEVKDFFESEIPRLSKKLIDLK